MNLSAGEQINMSSPYQVAPPQGNLLGSIMDFISQNRALQLDAGTRNQINSQTGFGSNVDPFAVQKYQGEGQRQQIAGNMDQRAQTEQNWQGADRQSQANTLGGLQGQFASDPVMGPLLKNGGSNAMIGETIMRMLGGDRTAAHQQEYANTNAGTDFAYNTSRDATQNKYALEQIKAQMEGRGAGRQSAQSESLGLVQQADSVYQKTGERRMRQQLELAGIIPGRDPATVMAEMAADDEYNKPGGKKELDAQRAAERADEIRRGRDGGPKPAQAAAGPPNTVSQLDGGTMPWTPLDSIKQLLSGLESARMQGNSASGRTLSRGPY